MAPRLESEIALVTGSTAGLGKEIARVFAAEGASVVVSGRHQERGDAVARAIQSVFGANSCVFVSADLSDEARRVELVEQTVAHFGGLTVLVNNAVQAAAAVHDGSVTDVSADVWDAVLQVDVVAVARLCALAIPHMQAAGHGSIVNVSSRAAERATPGLAAYIASKGAMNALTRSITVDYARAGIRCNTLQPGYILHETRDAELTSARRAELEAMHLTRLPTATDVAHAAAFLASREAEVITGITLCVDGGSTAARGRTLG